MSKSTTKQLDDTLTQVLGLELAPFTLTIKHAQKLSRLIKGFIFAYVKYSEIHYDIVELISECNGHRIRIPKFAIHPDIKQRIAKHQYHRWFAYCNDKLYPLQMAKPSVLEDSFIFKVNDDCLYRTQIAYTEETMFIRKKPLVICRPASPGWGVTLRRKEKLLEAV